MSNPDLVQWLHLPVTVKMLAQLQQHSKEQGILALQLMSTCNAENTDKARALASSVTTLNLIYENLSSVDGLKAFLEIIETTDEEKQIG